MLKAAHALPKGKSSISYLCKKYIHMGRIILEGMLFKSHIGVYDYEQLYGNNFEVDLSVESGQVESTDDDIHHALDYDALYRVIHRVMSGRYKLIETAGKKMISSLREEFHALGKITVRIAKIHPPIGGEVRKVWVELQDPE